MTLKMKTKPKYMFTLGQDNFIKNNFIRLSLGELSKSLGVSVSLIRRRKNDLKLNGKKQNKFNNKQIQFIRDNYDKLSDTETSKALGLSRYSITNARYRYNINKNHSKIRKRMMKEGIIKSPFAGKKIPKETIKKRLNTIKLRYGKITAWNKGKKGLQIAWNKGKKTPREIIEKGLKTKRENNSMPKGENHHFFGKNKYNSDIFKRASIRMINGGAFLALRGVKKPTSYELKISELCIENNFPFIYVGNGRFIIGNKNPDFVDKKNKKIIEVYSNYYKIKDYGSVENYESQRYNYFKTYNYETLFLNEEDINNINWKEICINKILSFINPMEMMC